MQPKQPPSLGTPCPSTTASVRGRDRYAEQKARFEESILKDATASEARSWRAVRDERAGVFDRRRAWRDWASQIAWEWFGTLTFRSPPSSDEARRAVWRWRHRLSRNAWGRNYWRDPAKGIVALVSFERHESGDWHAHFVAARTGEATIADARADWHRRWGNADIRPYVADAGGLAYVTKELDADFAALGPWPAQI